jgi:Uma2 family endonuclease
VPKENQRSKPASTKHLISVEDYHKMGEAGLFESGARVELIDGEIFDMTPIGTKHASTVTRLTDIFTEGLRGKAIVSVQNPIVLGAQSEPQPDLAVLKKKKDYYASAHPRPGDILLLIEVADTTACRDREIKVPLYARHGIPEVWLIDLEQKRLEVYHGPKAGEYRHVDIYRKEQVSPKDFPDLKVDLNELFLE